MEKVSSSNVDLPKYELRDGDLQLFLAEAKKLAEECGKMIVTAIEKQSNKEIQQKSENIPEGNSSAILTETDTMVENHLINGLKNRFPDHEFIGEESVSESGYVRELTNAPTWIIDPIDGTMNFVHSNPLVCTSIGLVVNKKLELGIVNCPLIGKMYTAVRGQGACLNGKRISISSVKDISKAMLIMEMPAGACQEKKDIALENLAHILNRAHAVRAPGPAALDIAWVAAGSADCFFHQGIHCWDMAAGALLVKEAGGVVFSTNGEEFDLMSRGIIASSSENVAKQVLSFLKIYSREADLPIPCFALRQD